MPHHRNVSQRKSLKEHQSTLRAARTHCKNLLRPFIIISKWIEGGHDRLRPNIAQVSPFFLNKHVATSSPYRPAKVLVIHLVSVSSSCDFPSCHTCFRYMLQ